MKCCLLSSCCFANGCSEEWLPCEVNNVSVGGCSVRWLVIAARVVLSVNDVAVIASVLVLWCPHRAAIRPVPSEHSHISRYEMQLLSSCKCGVMCVNNDDAVGSNSTLCGTFGMPVMLGPKNANCSNPFS